MRKTNRFYKNRYLIAFYDEDDCLRYVFDNIRELATFLNKDIQRTYEAVNSFLRFNCKHTFMLGEPLKMCLIDINEED